MTRNIHKTFYHHNFSENLVYKMAVLNFKVKCCAPKYSKVIVTHWLLLKIKSKIFNKTKVITMVK